MKILIIGGGDIGFDIVNRLDGEDHDITLIEEDSQRCEWVRDQLDVITITGDGTNIEILKEASIDDMDLVIGVTDSDNTNLVACMLAHQCGVPKKIARVTRSGPDMQQNAELLREVTMIDSLINPNRETANEIVELLKFPWA